MRRAHTQPAPHPVALAPPSVMLTFLRCLPPAADPSTNGAGSNGRRLEGSSGTPGTSSSAGKGTGNNSGGNGNPGTNDSAGRHLLTNGNGGQGNPSTSSNPNGNNGNGGNGRLAML